MESLPDCLFQDLELKGWACCDTLISHSQIAKLRHLAETLWQQGQFHAAHIGHLATKKADPVIRGDQICWLDSYSTESAIQDFLTVINQLQLALNQHYYLGLRNYEFHFARYEPGYGYKKHLDQHRNNRHRKISIVLYLNERWNEDDGGELCVYSHETEPIEQANRILPAPGRMAIFRSDMIWHEVQPSRKTRWSLTGWLRDDYLL